MKLTACLKPECRSSSAKIWKCKSLRLKRTADFSMVSVSSSLDPQATTASPTGSERDLHTGEQHRSALAGTDNTFTWSRLCKAHPHTVNRRCVWAGIYNTTHERSTAKHQTPQTDGSRSKAVGPVSAAYLRGKSVKQSIRHTAAGNLQYGFQWVTEPELHLTGDKQALHEHLELRVSIRDALNNRSVTWHPGQRKNNVPFHTDK